MLESFNLDKTYQALLILLAFLLPITVFGANTIIVVIVFLWLFSGNYKNKFLDISKSKLMLSSILFFSLHVVGMAWTENIEWGFHIIHKMWYFLLLFPILHNIVNGQYVKYYVSSFLLAITLTEIISYLVWFEIIGRFKNAIAYDPTPFMSHVSYNPILAFAIYLVCHEIFFNKNLTKLKFFWFSFFALTMTFNMFITGGRAGQIMFFVMLAILIFQFFDYQRVKALFIIIILLPGIFFTAYKTSPLFHERVNNGVEGIIAFNQNTDARSSVGYRLAFAKNSWDLIKDNPIIGVGTGDFPAEYKKINQINTPSLPNVTNPHNMYTLVLVQLGFLGLFSMLSIIYYQIKLSLVETNKFYRDVGITLPVLFLVIMLSDSYLLGHYTTLMYVFFSSFLYKKFD
jgi:O-antigen ligase